jgi:Na+/phosphate symporter
LQDEARMTEPMHIDWQLVDRLLQFVVLPALAWLWALQRQTSSHELVLQRLETMLAEREKHRAEEKKEFSDAIHSLNDTIRELRADIARISEMRK